MFALSRLKNLMMILAIVLPAIIFLEVRPIQGQATQYRAPRLPGTQHPDLSGIWQALNTANWDLRAHAARPALEVAPGPGNSLIGGPGEVIPAPPVRALGAIAAVPGGLGVVQGDEIPYQPWAAAKQRENFQNVLTRDPEVKCYLPGVPRATYMPYPFQIAQSAATIVMAYEYAGATRNISMTGEAVETLISAWMGYSNGRWEGETLVVDVKGFTDQTWFDRAGNFHSDELHVVERYTRTGPDHLQYEATITDPKVFTRPWTISMPLYRRLEPHAQLVEFKCVEFVEELIFGHLNKEGAVSGHWEGDYGDRGGKLVVDVTRGPSPVGRFYPPSR